MKEYLPESVGDWAQVLSILSTLLVANKPDQFITIFKQDLTIESES